MALRETVLSAFDHGAPCAEGDWSALGAHAARWPPGDPHRTTGVPALQQLAVCWADGLQVRLAQQVERISPSAQGWQLQLRDAVRAPVFDAVIVTVPQPQLAALLPDTALSPLLADIDYDPCWTLLWTPTAASLPPTPFAFAIDHPTLHTVIREDLKPGRSGPPRYVIHARADWSREWLECAPETVANTLLAEAAAWLGIAPEAHYRAAHRWRYAQVRKALGLAQCTLATGLHYASDGCLGKGIAGAITSGQAAAQALLHTLGTAR